MNKSDRARMVRAYDEGVRAFRRGEDKTACPYGPSRIGAYNPWMKGWEDERFGSRPLTFVSVRTREPKTFTELAVDALAVLVALAFGRRS